MAHDEAHANDALTIGVAVPLLERSRAHTTWTIHRWNEDATRWAMKRLGRQPDLADFQRLLIDPYAVTEVDGNLIVNAGWTRTLNLLTAAGGQGLTATSGRVGAGNGGGTAAAGDTDLSAAAGSANRWFQILSSGPTVSTNVLSMIATFGTADGNFAWNEFGIDIGTPTVTSGNTVNATLLNHKTSIAQGTKASGQTWTATATITYT